MGSNKLKHWHGHLPFMISFDWVIKEINIPIVNLRIQLEQIDWLSA